MTKAQQLNKRDNIGKYLVIGGLVLIVVWTLLLAATTWLSDLPCKISPNACSEGVGLAQFLLFAPLVAGCVSVPLGAIYTAKLDRAIKFFIVFFGATALFFAAYWTVAVLGIGIHGLGG
mgnify:CR=1 FL=1